MTDFLQIEQTGGVLTVTMSQPATRNALTATARSPSSSHSANAWRVTPRCARCADRRRPVFSSGGNVKDMRRFFDDALTPG